jgi:hypothetical protein
MKLGFGWILKYRFEAEGLAVESERGSARDGSRVTSADQSRKCKGLLWIVRNPFGRKLDISGQVRTS